MPEFDLVSCQGRFKGFGDRPALRANTESLSYADLIRMIELQSERLGPLIEGADFAIDRSENQLTQLVNFFALLNHQIAHVPRPLNSSSIAKNSNFSAQSEPNNFPSARVHDPAILELPGRVCEISGAKKLGSWTHASFESPDRPCLVVFTSGTSGKPKGVAHTLSSILHSAEGSRRFYKFDSHGLTSVQSLPLHQIGGFMLALRCLLGGGELLLPKRPLNGSESLDTVADIYTCVPTQLYRWLADPDSVAILQKSKMILVGSDQCPKSLAAHARDLGLTLSLSYGSSESCAQFAASRPECRSDLLQILPFREAKIKDGRLLIRGPMLFCGYFADQKFVRPFDDDGFFATGDLAQLSDGVLTIAGRTSSVFKCGGKQLVPEQLESLLKFSVPTSGFYRVFPYPCPEWGHRPAVLVVSAEFPNDALIRACLKSELPKTLDTIPICWQTKPGPGKFNPTGMVNRLLSLAYHETSSVIPLEPD